MTPDDTRVGWSYDVLGISGISLLEVFLVQLAMEDESCDFINESISVLFF